MFFGIGIGLAGFCLFVIIMTMLLRKKPNTEEGRWCMAIMCFFMCLSFAIGGICIQESLNTADTPVIQEN